MAIRIPSWRIIGSIAVASIALPLTFGAAPPSAPPSAPPPAPKQEDESKITVYRTKSGKRYHREGCGHMKGGGYSISLKDAKAAGLTPCGHCLAK